MNEANTQTPAGRLKLETNMADPDGFYEKLLTLHQGLDAQQSARVNARLVLLLANHVGCQETLDEAFALARESV